MTRETKDKTAGTVSPPTDEVTGVETTGHEWDGIRELNNPLPRWWLWTFYATIAWGLLYAVAYPAWPLLNGATAGLLGWSSRGEVAAEMQKVEAGRSTYWQALTEVDLAALEDRPELNGFAVQAGRALFANSCSQCHGSGAAGAPGYPNLLDDDWLWGGTAEEIATTIRYGIRDTDAFDTRFSQMPAFAEILSEEEIDSLAGHILSLGEGADPAAGPAGALYLESCAACHGDSAQGDRSVGAPDLTDAIWLYGGSRDEIAASIARGPFGVMPAWGRRLAEPQVRALAAYVHQLGGGEGAAPEAEPAPTDVAE